MQRGSARTDRRSPDPFARPPGTIVGTGSDTYPHTPPSALTPRNRSPRTFQPAWPRTNRPAPALKHHTHTNLGWFTQRLQIVLRVAEGKRLEQLRFIRFRQGNGVQTELLERPARAETRVFFCQHDVVVTNARVAINVILHTHLVPVGVVLVGEDPIRLYGTRTKWGT